MSESNQDNPICPECGRELPQDKGKPKVRLVEDKWVRFCKGKGCKWIENP